jgi:small-conductance mechanosensitive channel
MMQDNLPHLVQGLFTSAVFVAAILVLRYFIIRMIRRDNTVLSKDQRRWINRTKNGSIILAFVGLTMIWAPQLQTFALSLTAFVVAMVIATREMILCFVGSLFRVSTQPYKVGDWITIDGVSGEVMEINPFTTRMEEVDVLKSYAYTGRVVSIPNSKLFTAQVNILNVMKRYVAIDISSNVQFTDLDPAPLFDLYKKTVTRHVDGFYEDAKKFMARVSGKAGITMPDPAPSFGFRTTDLGHYVFSARIVVPTDRNGDVSTAIAMDFLSAVHKLRPPKTPPQDAKAA